MNSLSGLAEIITFPAMFFEHVSFVTFNHHNNYGVFLWIGLTVREHAVHSTFHLAFHSQLYLLKLFFVFGDRFFLLMICKSFMRVGSILLQSLSCGLIGAGAAMKQDLHQVSIFQLISLNL